MKPSPREQWQISKYFWMSLVGAFLYLGIAYVQGLIEVPSDMLWLLIVATIVEGGIRNILRWKRGGRLGDRTTLFFTYCDLLLITFSIGISGGVHSDLWLLFLMIMIVESLYLAASKKWLLDIQMTLFYLAGTLPRQFHHDYADPPGIYLRIFGIHLFFIILVTAITRRLSMIYADRGNELALLREQQATTEERTRIAREVHDSLGHALVGSILRLELAQRLVSRKPEETAQILQEEIPAIRAAWNEGRDLAFYLRPWEQGLEAESLPDLLRRLTQRFAMRAGIAIELEVEEGDWQLSGLILHSLMRIVQEALTNAVRHGKATQVLIKLYRPPHKPGRRDSLICIVKDNGQGFDVDIAKTSGVGVASIRERATALSGTLTISSNSEHGTQIHVDIPL